MAQVGTSLGTMEMGRNACVEAVPSQMIKVTVFWTFELWKFYVWTFSGTFEKAYLARKDIGSHEIDTAIMYCGGNTEKILGNYTSNHFM